MNSTETCKWLHKQLEKLPLIRYPFDMENLPKDGIYFFYEDGEIWGHGGVKPRIVRIGTHKSGNFRSRIKDHFVLNEKNIENLNKNKSKPADRSIFRKNIGRSLLKKENNSYIKIWEKDFIEKEKRKKIQSFKGYRIRKEN